MSTQLTAEQASAQSSTTSDVGETRERLLEAGLVVFAQRGFQEASVRQICAQAGASPAAVNYHFGSKGRFYAEVLVTSHQRAVASRRMPRLGDDPDRPTERLGAWVRWFLELLLVEGEKSPLGQLMAREMFAPTEALGELVRRSFLPMYSALGEIVIALEGELTEGEKELYLQSILGQCLFYKHAQPAAGHLRRILHPEGPEQGPEADLERLAAHITRVSLAGLQAAGTSFHGEVS